MASPAQPLLLRISSVSCKAASSVRNDARTAPAWLDIRKSKPIASSAWSFLFMLIGHARGRKRDRLLQSRLLAWSFGSRLRIFSAAYESRVAGRCAHQLTANHAQTSQ